MDSRFLHFDTLMAQGQPICARCDRCSRKFVGTYRAPKERTDEVLLRMRVEFDAHDCGRIIGQNRSFRTRLEREFM
jgi:hypothetical protein